VKIPYGKQNIDQDDINSVISVLKSDFLTQGPKVPVFERAVSNYCGARFAFATNSATSALHIACLALEVQPGDVVWTTPISFVASANCALYCGAEIDFVDIDPISCNMSPQCLEIKLAEAEHNGRLPKVVIPVHLRGEPCDMAAIAALADRYGFKVIEDASHAIGSRYRGEQVGNCKYSDITIFSFHPVKIITTGEGGMAVTNDELLGSKLARLRSHGITRDRMVMQNNPDGPWYYEQIELGFNYRMTDLQAALGTSQMNKIDTFIAERHRLAENYDKLLENEPLQIPSRDPNNFSALHLYVIRIPSTKGKTEHLDAFNRMQKYGIGVNLHYIPIYRQPYYAKLGFCPTDWPNSEIYYSQAMTLPLYPGLTSEEQKYIVNVLNKSMFPGYQDIF
jgi:UDP-4-amino-4,6-dideoxy-N-acetyl-beta-L-altrosamine transaminase